MKYVILTFFIGLVGLQGIGWGQGQNFNFEIAGSEIDDFINNTQAPNVSALIAFLKERGRPDDLPHGIGLDSTNVPWEDPNDCAVHEFSFPGQGPRAISTNPSSSSIKDANNVGGTLDFGALAGHLNGLIPSPSGQTEQVTLIVFDDFTNFLSGIPVNDQLTVDLPPHGVMVEDHLIKLLDVPNISLIQVSLEGNFKASMENLRTALVNLGPSSLVVVNMSFVLLPCKTLDLFEANKGKFELFDDYEVALLAALLSDNVNDGRSWVDVFNSNITMTRSELMTLLGTNDEGQFNDFASRAHFILSHPHSFARGNENNCTSDGDDAIQILCDNAFPNTVFVASSGNFGSFEMFPAALPNVIGVGAVTPDSSPQRANFSNVGEILDFGAFFPLDELLGDSSFQDLFYSGTSFSAPNISFLLAKDLANGVQDCKDELLSLQPSNSFNTFSFNFDWSCHQ